MQRASRQRAGDICRHTDRQTKTNKQEQCRADRKTSTDRYINRDADRHGWMQLAWPARAASGTKPGLGSADTTL